MRCKNNLGAWIIADDARHNGSSSITIGVHMHDVPALAQHACQPHRAVKVTNSLKREYRHWNIHLLKLLDDVVMLGTYHLDIEIRVMPHVSHEVACISLSAAPRLARDYVKNIYHDITCEVIKKLM